MAGEMDHACIGGAVQKFIRGKQISFRVKCTQTCTVQDVIQGVQGIRIQHLRIVRQHSCGRVCPRKVQGVAFFFDLRRSFGFLIQDLPQILCLVCGSLLGKIDTAQHLDHQDAAEDEKHCHEHGGNTFFNSRAKFFARICSRSVQLCHPEDLSQQYHNGAAKEPQRPASFPAKTEQGCGIGNIDHKIRIIGVGCAVEKVFSGRDRTGPGIQSHLQRCLFSVFPCFLRQARGIQRTAFQHAADHAPQVLRIFVLRINRQHSVPDDTDISRQTGLKLAQENSVVFRRRALLGGAAPEL